MKASDQAMMDKYIASKELKIHTDCAVKINPKNFSILSLPLSNTFTPCQLQVFATAAQMSEYTRLSQIEGRPCTACKSPREDMHHHSDSAIRQSTEFNSNCQANVLLGHCNSHINVDTQYMVQQSL